MSSFSFSRYKSIRHTSTLALLSIGQALVDVYFKEAGDLERVQTFIRTEIQSADSQRLLHLQNQQEEIRKKTLLLNTQLDDIFNDTIKHRCLDVLMEIRAICLQALNYMIQKFPAKFLNEDILKIIEYSLYDKAPEVRLKSLEFIASIFVEENYEKMQNLIERNRLRLVEMTHDIENKCSITAIFLCATLAQRFSFSPDEKNMIACLI